MNTIYHQSRLIRYKWRKCTRKEWELKAVVRFAILVFGMQWTNLSTHMYHNVTESGVHRNFLLLPTPQISTWRNECGCIYLTSIFDTLHWKSPFSDATISSHFVFFFVTSQSFIVRAWERILYMSDAVYMLYSVRMDKMHAIYCDNGMTDTYSFLRNALWITTTIC